MINLLLTKVVGLSEYICLSGFVFGLIFFGTLCILFIIKLICSNYSAKKIAERKPLFRGYAF